jgi:F-box protein 9
MDQSFPSSLPISKYRDYSGKNVLTNSPSAVVPILRPSLRSKGLHFGRWRIEKGKVFITDLLEPGIKTPKYEFEMELNLKETQRGKWNKLDIHRYSSINLADGEVLGLSLKHQKPFYFSK